MTRKVCVITGSRADYGLLRWVMHGIKCAPDLTLQTIVTGQHLSKDFGSTYQEIEQDGFLIDRKVEILTNDDTWIGIAKSMGMAQTGFSNALHELKPDLILVLGDRYEIFSAVSVALVACIPVAHIHGGEVTEGAFDDALRHAITKMSHLHFVAAETYLQRVIQMGERQQYVFLVGGLGVDAISRVNLLNKSDLENNLGFDFLKKNLLITFHPPTLDESTAKFQMRELLKALSDFSETRLIFTVPNADTESRTLIEMIEIFVARHPNARLFKSLGQLRYLSCIRYVDGVVGNSSSGLLEVPTFKKATVNIGSRQSGRLMAKSVINCDPDAQSIKEAIKEIYTDSFRALLEEAINPYGNGGATEKIVDVLRTIELGGIIRKTFNDLSNIK